MGGEVGTVLRWQCNYIRMGLPNCGFTSEAGTSLPPGALEFTPGFFVSFVLFHLYSTVQCFVDYSVSFFVLFRLVIVLSVLQLTNSDYIFGIFTLFFTFFLYLLMSYYILFIYPWSMLNNRNRQYKQPQQHEPPI